MTSKELNIKGPFFVLVPQEVPGNTWKAHLLASVSFSFGGGRQPPTARPPADCPSLLSRRPLWRDAGSPISPQGYHSNVRAPTDTGHSDQTPELSQQFQNLIGLELSQIKHLFMNSVSLVPVLLPSKEVPPEHGFYGPAAQRPNVECGSSRICISGYPESHFPRRNGVFSTASASALKSTRCWCYCELTAQNCTSVLPFVNSSPTTDSSYQGITGP